PKAPSLSPTASEEERRLYDEVHGRFEYRYENSPKPSGFALFPKRELSLPPTPESASPGETEDQFQHKQVLYSQFQRYFTELNEYQATPQFVVVPHLDVGILFVFSVSSLAVYG